MRSSSEGCPRFGGPALKGSVCLDDSGDGSDCSTRRPHLISTKREQTSRLLTRNSLLSIYWPFPEIRSPIAKAVMELASGRMWSFDDPVNVWLSVVDGS